MSKTLARRVNSHLIRATLVGGTWQAIIDPDMPREERPYGLGTVIIHPNPVVALSAAAARAARWDDEAPARAADEAALAAELSAEFCMCLDCL